ncbi:MAG: hypothetical protein V3W32_06155 [Gemmatimonadota bacterium]
MSLDLDQLIAGRPLWLLEVEWLGRLYRWASELPGAEPLILVDADGSDLEYRGGLDLNFSDKFALFSESAAPETLSVSLYFGDLEDVPARVAEGHDLSTMTARLYRWAPGMSHADRIGVFFGEAREPSYGSRDEPVAVTFESPIYRDGARWPSGALTADHLTIDASRADGSPYPIVFGSPGLDLGAASSEGAGLEVPTIVDATGYLMGGVWYGASYSATWDTSAEPPATVAASPSSETDLQGRRYTRIDVGASFSADASYAIAFDGPGYGAGDLLSLCARQSTLRVDFARMEATAPALNAYKLAGYLDTSVQPWEWALRNVVPLLPVSAMHTPAGVALRVWDAEATAADALADLSTDNGLTRIGPVQLESGDLINEITIRYAPALSGDFQREITLTGRDGIGATVSPYCVASRSRLAPMDAAGPLQGVRATTLETAIVYETATARRIASWMVRARANRRRAISYEAPRLLEWLEPADHVLLTDPELALSGALAMVRTRRWLGGRFVLDLVLVDEIGRAG